MFHNNYGIYIGAIESTLILGAYSVPDIVPRNNTMIEIAMLEEKVKEAKRKLQSLNTRIISIINLFLELSQSSGTQYAGLMRHCICQNKGTIGGHI